MSAVLAPSADPVPPFQITILTHAARSLRLAKRWRLEDGKPVVDGYEDAKTYRVSHKPVTCLMDFVQLLRDLKTDPYSCMIHGELRPEKVGLDVVHRDLAHFQPRPTQLLVLDVDSFTSFMVDATVDPAGAVADFIESQLPAEFQGVSYAFKLSGSFGQKQGLLKCHIFMWLDTALYPEQLKAYVRNRALPVDTAVFRTVQAVYTADPVFDDGLKDPAPYRVRYVRARRDSLTLELTQADLSGAEVHMDGSVDLTDPCEKPGLIGAFHRAFTMEEVIDTWLSDVFEFQQGSDRRLNFLQGGGAAGGAWVHESRQYIQNTHNSCPLGGRMTNKWDLVRHYVYGHLDAGLDAFELLDVAGRPSHKAMEEMVAGLDQVKATVVEEVKGPLAEYETLIRQCTDAVELSTVVCAQIKADRSINDINREHLGNLIKTRHQELSGSRIGIAVVRRAITPSRGEVQPDDMVPHWAQNIVYLRGQSKFFDVNNGRKWTVQDFNLEFNQFLGPARETTAAALSTDNGWIDTVQDTMYVPFYGARFLMEELEYVNAYLPSTVPDSRDMGMDAWHRVELFKEHLLKLCNGRAWLRDELIRWMAYNVQKPGVKIIWAWLIKGCPGDGKTLIRSVLTAAMGGQHVGEASSKALHSDFNGFVHGRSVVVLEEIRVSGKSRFDVLDSLKAPITNERITVHRKGENERDVLNTTNYLAFTNHSDALPLDETDRRWGTIFSPYLSLKELADEVGDTSAYFEPLHELYRDYGPHVRHWLLGVDVSAFNPKGIAPFTEEKAALREISQSDIDTVIEELVKDLDIVSSKWLTASVDRHEDGVRVSRKLLPKLLEKFGFRAWYKQFWFDSKNITVYGREKRSAPADVVRAYLTETKQDEIPGPF